jgi:hypothetical protein
VVGKLDVAGPAVRRRAARLAALAGIALAASAHVGSPDTYFEGDAGPYPVRVIVRNPGVVPGLAQITVRLLGPRDVGRVLVLPVFWDPKIVLRPPPDVAQRVPGDSTLFSAALWLMLRGPYSVEVTVEGDAGSGTVLVPVLAIATRRLALQRPLGLALLALGALLVTGALTIVGAAVRESVLEPGAAPDHPRRVRARIAMGAGAVVLALALGGGRAWWNAVDADYRTGLSQSFRASAAVRAAGARQVLRLAIDDTTGSAEQPAWSPLIPDHGHLMHLFLVRDSALDAFAHLHPVPLDSATFEADLPPLVPGRYRVYADIVRESGFAQTFTATVTLPVQAGAHRATDTDDAWVLATGQGEATSGRVTSPLADGSIMIWERGETELVVDDDRPLRFEVLAPDGTPATLEPYMGMVGHAMLTRDDGAVFVHLHPAGTISLAAQQAFLVRAPGDTVPGALGVRLAERERDARMHAAHPGAARLMPHAMSFPYAFPQPGRYRLWVQVKRDGRILTGVFDATVQPAR